MAKQRYYTGELALTREEYNKLLSVCDDPQDRLLLMVGVSLGLRRSDLVRIMVRNIDFTSNTLTYNEKKKGNRIRTVPLSNKLSNELKMYLKLSNKGVNDRLFNFMDRQAWNRYNALCDKAGIKRRPIHTLRSTCCKFLLQSGWRPEEVASLIGDNVSTVMEHYTKPSHGELQKLMKEKEII